MARQLWLLRHGEAVPHGSKPDSDRELTPRGEQQATLAGRGLAALSLEITACYTSPKVRARETARLACEELGAAFEEISSLAGGFDRGDAEELLALNDADARVLVVGHEPDFSQVVYDYTGARVDFKKGGVAAIRLDGSRGELIGLYRPKDLEAMAASVGSG